MNTLIKQLIIVFLLLISSNMYGQFKMVGDAGSGGFTSLGNNIYSCTITYRPDLTGNFFNGTQTQIGFKLFTSSEQMYTITNVSNTSINTASVVFISDTTITQNPLFYGTPKGEIIVYDASEIVGVLQAPFGTVGASARMQAAVDSWNIKKLSNLLDNVNTVPSVTSDSFNLIKFNTQLDTVTSTGQVSWNTEDGTLDIATYDGVVLQTNQETVVRVKNKSGQPILNGMPVRFAGTEGASSRLLVQSSIADNSYPVYYNLGIATQDIQNDTMGFVTVFGKIRGVDLDGPSYLNCNDEPWEDGYLLYGDPDSTGCLTMYEPMAPNQKVLYAAIVAAKNNGTMMVRPSLFPDIKDLQGLSVDTPSDEELLVYRNGVWTNDTISVNYVFTPFKSDGVNALQIGIAQDDKIPVSRPLSGRTVTKIEYTLESPVAGNNTIIRLTAYDPSTGTYDPFGAVLMSVGQHRSEVFTSEVLELGNILYAEVTQSGTNITDLLVTLTIK